MSGNSKSYFFSNKTTSNGNQFKRFAARSGADKPDGSNAIALINSRLNGTVMGTHQSATNTSSIGGTSTSTTTKATSKAGATSSSGWMTVKRRGVDDELIKRDSQKAKLDRLKQCQKGRTQRMKLLRKEVQQKQYKQQKARKTNSKTKQSWKKRQESSEDEESFSSGSSSEEEIILTSSSSDEESQPMEGEEEDDEDIKSPVPLPTGRTRSHSKPNIAYSKRRSSYTATNDPVIDVDREEEGEMRHQKDAQASNSEDDNLFLSKPTFSQKKNDTQSVQNSFHDEKTEPTESKGRSLQGNTQPKRRILEDSSSEEDDDDCKSSMKLAIKKSLSENNSHGYLSDDVPKEELRALEIAQKRSLEEYKNNNNLTQRDTQWLLESTSPAAASRFKRLKKQNSSCNENNNSNQVLLGKVFKGTTNHFQKNSNSKTIKKGSGKTDEVQYYSDDSSSSDATRGTDENNDDAMSFHGGDDEEDGAINDEATTVLETVNELSSRVLHRMQAFCNHLQETNSDKSTTSVQGMIVDGALAMSTFATTAEEEAANNEKALVSRDALSKCLSSEMMIHDYQLIGVNWMALMNTLECYDNRQGKKGKRRAKSNVNGVLADEMGLGKTVQTIAFLAWLKYGNTNKRKKENLSIVPSSSAHGVINLDDDSTSDDGEDDVENNQPALSNQATCPHLIVVPASVLSNWMREFEKVCPGLVVQIYHGTQEERMNLRSELRKRQEGSPDIDVILTTFSYFSNERNDDRKFLGKIKFDYMVVDEAHSLKNPKGKRYQELDRIKTSHRLLLTGTVSFFFPIYLSILLSLSCFNIQMYIPFCFIFSLSKTTLENCWHYCAF